MLALLVCASPETRSVDLVSKLAMRADFIVGVDAGAELCADAGVRPDLVVGDLDSCPPGAAQRYMRLGIEVVTFPADKDMTDLELALDIVRSRGYDSVILTAASLGRADHSLGVLGAIAYSHDLRPELIEPESHSWILSAESRRELDLAGLGSTVSVIAILGSAIVSVEGTKWPLRDALLLPLSGIGISNVVCELSARVTVTEGTVIVISPRVDGQRPAIETSR